eukprot:IDg8699t1
MNTATHQSVSYLDLRVRVFMPHHESIESHHLIALLMRDRHTSVVIFEMIAKFSDILAPEWRMQLLFISTDGARNMTGLHQGVVTRLCEAALEHIYEIWCGAHQLDLVMEHVLCVVLKDSFYSTLTGFISQKIVADMGSTRPKLVNRWLSSNKSHALPIALPPLQTRATAVLHYTHCLSSWFYEDSFRAQRNKNPLVTRSASSLIIGYQSLSSVNLIDRDRRFLQCSWIRNQSVATPGIPNVELTKAILASYEPFGQTNNICVL